MARYSIVLAAGRGERLWPITSTRPKPLLPLPGGYLLARMLRKLEELSKSTIIVVHHYSWMIEKLVESEGVNAVFVKQEAPLGTGHAAIAALRRLPRDADEVILVYGDLLFDLKMLDRLLEAGAPALIGVERRDYSNYGVLRASGECLEGIVEKPEDMGVSSALVNAGIYLLQADLVAEYAEKLKPSPRGEYELTDIVSMISKERCVKIVRSSGYWVDLGRPWDYLNAVRFLLSNIREEVRGEVEPGAVLRGPVFVGEAGIIRSGSVIEGPAWIEGEVGPQAHVRPYSFVARSSFIGAFAQVKASVIMEGAKIPHLNYVGDSIVGEGANLGAGTITANLRFDRKSVRTLVKKRLVDTGLKKFGAVIGGYSQTGINVSIMPGVKIGGFSWIDPGAVVRRDVPDCVFYREGGITPLSKYGINCSPREAPWELGD